MSWRARAAAALVPLAIASALSLAQKAARAQAPNPSSPAPNPASPAPNPSSPAPNPSSPAPKPSPPVTQPGPVRYRIAGCRSRGPATYRQGPHRREVAIGFDDGPAPLTPAFVAMLERNHARATFFMIGQQVSRGWRGTLIEEMSLVGPPEKIREDLEKWRESIVTTLLISGDAATLNAAAELVLG